MELKICIADDVQPTIEQTTTYRTAVNRFPMRCAVCGGRYYVVERIFSEIRVRFERNPSENPFWCDSCLHKYPRYGVEIH
jgi:hypothetical protein